MMNKNKSRGFSLIEVVIVIMILAILAMVVLPRSADFINQMNLKAAGDKILDDLRYIHEYAGARHDTTWLVVNINDNNYGIYSGSSPATRQLILDPSTNQRALFDLDEQFSAVTITAVDFGGNTEFFYNWWGTPNVGGTITLNNTKVISITPGTGYVY